ncbi:hypothetical protein VCR17J2_380088 [Vibrio coralliirubri]|nr:hypothetical protein VCR17J2_380088 [Vibrio coralliirubri]
MRVKCLYVLQYKQKRLLCRIYKILIITVTNVLQIGVLCDDIHVNLELYTENFRIEISSVAHCFHFAIFCLSAAMKPFYVIYSFFRAIEVRIWNFCH